MQCCSSLGTGRSATLKMSSALIRPSPALFTSRSLFRHRLTDLKTLTCCSVVRDASARAKCLPLPACQQPAQRFCVPLLLPDDGSFCPESNRPGWLAGCVPWGPPSRLQAGSGMSPPHGPIASTAVHKNSWLELGTLNWPILQGLPELPPPARPSHTLAALPACPRSQTDKDSCLAGFACENPLRASLGGLAP